MSPVCAGRHLERRKKTKDTDRVETVEHLRSQLYLESLRHLCNSACHVVIVALGPIGEAIDTVVQGCPVVPVDRLAESY